MHNQQAPQFDLITDAAALRQWCDHNAGASFVALDTEFERQRTYYAELCLIQLASPDSICCIDTLAGVDLVSVFNYLTAPERTVIIHAARQDLEVLFFAGAGTLAPLHDTQLAAALCGFADQVGYADLVHKLLGVTLDKSQTRTNWRQRPLTARQLDYAADDVRYLAAVYTALIERLEAQGRRAWFEEDCAALLDPALLDPPLEDAWARVKGIGGLSQTAFARAVALAAWREREAQQQNLPRGWVLKDPDLVTLAHSAPADRQALADVLVNNAALIRRHGDALLELMATAQRAPLPARDSPLDVEQRKRVKQFAAAVRALAEAQSINSSSLLTRREMEQIVRGEVPTRVAHGWRAQVLAGVLNDFGVDLSA